MTATVHDGSHVAVAGAAVTGTFSSGGTASCTTGTGGSCVLSSANISNNTSSVNFTVTSPAATANHDPDTDSDGTFITVSK
ncbi:MAG: hypothetical protein AAB289_07925 [Chloroflexota bacterium]